MSSCCFVLLLLLPLISAQSFHWGSCPTPAVQPDFNVQAYMGKWYHVEMIPAWFANGKCIEADYSLNEDGTVQVLNSQVLKGKRMVVEGTAKVMDPLEPAKLGVTFFSFIPYHPYWVLSTDYTNYTIVYSCTEFRVFHFNLAWIFSRSPSLPDETMIKAKELLISKGIDTSEMKSVKQDCGKDGGTDENYHDAHVEQ